MNHLQAKLDVLNEARKQVKKENTVISNMPAVKRTYKYRNSTEL